MFFPMFKDKAFTRALFKLSYPIAIYYLVINLTRFLDLMMVGQLGDLPVAAMGLADQIFFLLELLMFGIANGSAVLMSQFWGVKDVKGIRNVLGLCLGLSLGGSLLIGGAAVLFPRQILSIYSNDAIVQELGSQYLRVVGFSYIAVAFTSSFNAILRSVHHVKLPMTVIACSLALDVLLCYALIFGRFGLPAMGLMGAAFGISIARVVEGVAMVVAAYLTHTPAAASFGELTGASPALVQKFIKVSMPVVVNEIVWSLGFTMYKVAYAHINTDSIAAINIISTIEELTFVPFVGMIFGSAVLIGNNIGAGNINKANTYAKRTIFLCVFGALILGGVILLNVDRILYLYNISPITKEYARNTLLVFASLFWIRVINMAVIVGIIRSGGDTRFSLITELCTMWLVGVPLAFLGVFVFHLPVYWVYCLVLLEEVVKALVGLTRFISKRWIHDLVRQPV
jgi:putative MATE family efflux protein